MYKVVFIERLAKRALSEINIYNYIIYFFFTKKVIISTFKVNKAFKYLIINNNIFYGFLGSSVGKEYACSHEIQVKSLGWEDALEKEMTNRSSVLA